ncbi:GNAT family N-acetyltransferase [Photobacterium galatheae]|uniref:GNAT family acetyltransferase n=1 Tax=Photobacterium galatheae TaxID=1654360 RepID=A0A066RRB8_9GAMM|nr:GNAT family protein [Photobacterium galatheae]KDM91651.1 GNAT family acetyltransferase [Photobacterium galatheae]MCM0149725.1 GNAT family N-acetyltransferase [Photobacterium galatheae]
MNFPELETERLTLKQLTIQDTASIFALFSNAAVIEFYDLEVFSDLSQSVNFIGLMQERFDSKSGIRWGIHLKETGDLVGTCGFNSWNSRMKSAVIGYDLLPSYWGNGLITEAVHQIVAYAFSDKLPCGEINRIQADTIPGNVASESVLLKTGFKEEGLRRQSGYWKNQFPDLKCFGLIKSDYTEI